MNWEISQAGSDSILWTGVNGNTRLWLVLPAGEVPKYDTGYTSPEKALAQWEEFEAKIGEACSGGEPF